MGIFSNRFPTEKLISWKDLVLNSPPFQGGALIPEDEVFGKRGGPLHPHADYKHIIHPEIPASLVTRDLLVLSYANAYDEDIVNPEVLQKKNF